MFVKFITKSGDRQRFEGKISPKSDKKRFLTWGDRQTNELVNGRGFHLKPTANLSQAPDSGEAWERTTDRQRRVGSP